MTLNWHNDTFSPEVMTGIFAVGTYAILRSNLANQEFTAGQFVFVKGKESVGDGYEGLFQVKPAGSLADNDNNIIVEGDWAAVRHLAPPNSTPGFGVSSVRHNAALRAAMAEAEILPRQVVWSEGSNEVTEEGAGWFRIKQHTDEVDDDRNVIVGGELVAKRHTGLTSTASYYNALDLVKAPGRNPSFTYTRTTAGALTPMHDRTMYQPEPNEISARGLRRIRNLITTPKVTDASWNKAQVTVAEVTVAGPDVINVTAYSVTENNANNYHYISQTVLTSGTDVYARFVIKRFGADRDVRIEGSGVFAVFDMSAGTLSSGVGGITNLGNGWYEIWARATVGSNLIAITLVSGGAATYTGDNASGFYVLKPMAWLARKGQLIPDPEYVSRGVVTDDMIGPEMITNGTFATDTSWTKGANVSIGSGVLSVTSVPSTQAAFQQIALNAGSVYQVSFDVVSGAGIDVAIQLCSDIDGANGSTLTYRNATGTYTEYITATAAQTGVRLRFQSGTTVAVDNVSIRHVYYHGWGIDGVECFDTDEYGNPLEAITRYGHNLSRVECAVEGATVIGSNKWASVGAVTAVRVGDGIQVTASGAGQYIEVSLFVHFGLRLSISFDASGQVPLVTVADISQGIFEATGTNSMTSPALGAQEHTIVCRANIVYIRFYANNNSAGTTLYQNLKIREIVNGGALGPNITRSGSSGYSGAVNNGNETYTLPDGAWARFTFPLASLFNEQYYEVTFELSGNHTYVIADFADQRGTIIYGNGVKKLIARRWVYDVTYNFVDIQAYGGTALVTMPVLRRVYPIQMTGVRRRPALTNHCGHSNGIGNVGGTGWTANSSPSAVAAADGPLGTCAEITSSINGSGYYRVAITNAVNGQAYNGSVYAKGVTAGVNGNMKIRLSLEGSGLSPKLVYADLKDGVITSGSDPSARIEPVLGFYGWYRISLTNTATSTGQVVITIYGWDGANLVFRASCAQVEAGDVANDHVLTASTAVTANAEEIKLTSSLGYQSAEGALLFVEHTPSISVDKANNGQQVIRLQTDANNRMQVYNRNGSFGVQVINDSAEQWAAQSDAGKWIPYRTQVVGVRLKANDGYLAADGKSLLTDSAMTIPAVTDIHLGGDSTGLYCGSFRRVYAMVPGALTDSYVLRITDREFPGFANEDNDEEDVPMYY